MSSIRKIGGIWFARLGRVQLSACVTRPAMPVRDAIFYCDMRGICTDYDKRDFFDCVTGETISAIHNGNVNPRHLRRYLRRHGGKAGRGLFADTAKAFAVFGAIAAGIMAIPDRQPETLYAFEVTTFDGNAYVLETGMTLDDCRALDWNSVWPNDGGTLDETWREIRPCVAVGK